MFEPLFPKRKNRRFRKKVKGLRSLAGPVRDCDIALELIAREAPGEDAATTALTEHRRRAAAELASALGEWPSAGLAKRWSKRLKLGKKRPRKGRPTGVWRISRSAAWNASRVLPPVAEEFLEAGDVLAETDDGAAFHEFRIRAKRLRYMLELFRPVYGDRLDKKIGLLKCVQDSLGRVNDCRVTLAMLAEKGCLNDGVRQRLGAAEQRELAEFKRLWSDGFAGRHKKWIRSLSRPEKR